MRALVTTLGARAGDFLDVRPRTERVLTAVILALAWTGGYQTIGWSIDGGRAVSLATPLDGAIPFIPETVYLYGLVYGAALYPLFVVRSRALLRRTALAYVVVIAVSLACFVVFPVTCAALRPPLAEVDPGTLHGWGLRLIYRLDPPANLFPSLHVGLAAIGAAAAWRACPRHALLAVGIVAGTVLSVCTVKQHFVADAVAALALVALVDQRLLRTFRPPDDEPLAYGWRGPAGYVVLQLGLYGALALAFAAGVRV
jgi:hypothetical protein